MRIDRQFGSLRTEIVEAVIRIYESGRVLQGKEISELEETMMKESGRKHAVAVGSCTDALFFALKSTSLKPGDEVIVTCLSFLASASCIPRAGLFPVFSDIDPKYYMMDIDSLDKLVTERTKAIITVSLFGQMINMEKVMEFAQRHNLIVIEDAAQSLGSSYKDKPAGSFGDISCLSFDPTKVVNAHATSGMLLTDDSSIAETVRGLRYHGKNQTTGTFDIIGNNSQMSSLQAALLMIKMKRCHEWEDARIRIATRYSDSLSSLKEVSIPKTLPYSKHIYHKYVMRVKDRDGLKKYLAEHGIGTNIHYRTIIPDQPCMQPYMNSNSRFPIAEDVSKNILSLPIYPELTEKEVDYITESIKEFYKL